jgi:hypothetical protein
MMESTRLERFFLQRSCKHDVFLNSVLLGGTALFLSLSLIDLVQTIHDKAINYSEVLYMPTGSSLSPYGHDVIRPSSIDCP